MTKAAASLFDYNLLTDLNIKVWVLAPSIESSDEQIDYYYDFSQSISEYTSVFEKIKLPWQWMEVNMNTFKSVIDSIAEVKKAGGCFPVILNLCDGDEINGAPGVSVIHYLEEKELVYTGADSKFYEITTSKVPMKKAFDKAGVANAAWDHFSNEKNYDAERIIRNTGTPVIVKPAVSGGSMGVGIKNVVDNRESLDNLVKELLGGYRGWNLNGDGFIAEKFIAGPEYTVFISGSYDRPKDAVIYEPVERVFHDSLPENEKFLSFERLWEIYETETAMPGQDNFYEYKKPDSKLISSIKKISWDAYVAVKGKGYTRVDVRMDNKTGALFVLEVNAQCGISEDENFTSIGAILRMSKKSFSGLVEEIINDAIKRGSKKVMSFLKNKKSVRLQSRIL